MRCCNNYQEIKSPEDEEEDKFWESEYESMLDEFDPELAGNCSFSTYKRNCRAKINKKRYSAK